MIGVVRKLREIARPCVHMAFLVSFTHAPVNASAVRRTQHPSDRDATVSLKLADASFERAIGELTSQCGLNVIADGACPEFRRTLNFSGSPKAALAYIVKEYDYEAAVSGSGVYTLRRRLVAPGAKPQFDVAEVRQCAKDIVRLYRLCGYRTYHGAGYYLRELYRQLSPAEQQQLLAGRELRYSNLSSDLARFALQSVITNLFGATPQPWESLDVLLSGIPSGKIAIESAPADPATQLREHFAVFRAKDEAGNTRSITLFRIDEK